MRRGSVAVRSFGRQCVISFHDALVRQGPAPIFTSFFFLLLGAGDPDDLWQGGREAGLLIKFGGAKKNRNKVCEWATPSPEA